MKIDISKNILSIITENPEIKNQLIDLGFHGLDNPIMLQTVGKNMSIKRGSKMLGIDDIDQKLEALGYEIIDSSMDQEVIDRKSKIESYIKRLSAGEDLEEVREDFKNNFKNVSSSEIMDAEESLLLEGMDKEEVRKLCDVHSALFHGMTVNEEKDTHYTNPVLQYFADENNKIKSILSSFINYIEGDTCHNPFEELATINSHYKKKGDLLYPLLKFKYNKPGPSEVMWAVDGEITRDLRIARKKSDDDLLKKAIDRALEMTYKEENILLPLLEEKFSNEDYIKIYTDLKEYDSEITSNYPYPDATTTVENNESTISDGYINFDKGRLNIEQVKAIFDTFDLEITFVNDQDINTYYNDNNEEKIFKRPSSSLGRDVYSCHPPQVEPKVRKIIGDFKNGARDKVQVVRNIAGSDYTVTYYAVRDKNGKYIGVLETVQNMDYYKRYLQKFGNK